MPRCRIYARPDDVIASIAKDKQAEQEFLHKGYALIGIAKFKDGFDVMGIRIAKGGEKK